MTPARRCAIYTRKSSDEGLEQEFNSLHAQRESCEAYVLSQAGEGWSAIATAYDDGGYSGGSMERPGLQRLLADIAAGRIDVVVVYKVDRLTRSLADFAKIVEAFDQRGVSFVSVTQAFNTTTSMGRLTLNVLLSFAQFEREVTAERIRDKVAASKAKGIWMGGMVPLGYDLRDRQLHINDVEANVVRKIFARYLELGSAKKLAVELDEQGIRSKAWVTLTGRQMGGAKLGRGGVFHILQNRLYLGEIVHGSHVHPGRHPPIIERDVFDAVAAKLMAGAAPRRERATRAAAAPLQGLIHDADGHALSPSFSYGRGGRVYRYYISMALQVGAVYAPGLRDGPRRLSAPQVESWLTELVGRLTDRPELEASAVRPFVHRIELREHDTHVLLRMQTAFQSEHPELVMDDLVKRLEAGERAVVEGGEDPLVRIAIPKRLQLRGGRTWLHAAAGDKRGRAPDARLLTALKRAHADLVELGASPFTPRHALQDARAPATQHDRQVIRLALMAPDLQRRILDGEQPLGLKLRQLLKSPMPLAWDDQRAWFEKLSRSD